MSRKVGTLRQHMSHVHWLVWRHKHIKNIGNNFNIFSLSCRWDNFIFSDLNYSHFSPSPIGDDTESTGLLLMFWIVILRSLVERCLMRPQCFEQKNQDLIKKNRWFLYTLSYASSDDIKVTNILSRLLAIPVDITPRCSTSSSMRLTNTKGLVPATSSCD